MDDCTHAWRRLAAIRAQEAALEARRRRDVRRLRAIGTRDLVRALRPLRLVKDQTIIAEQSPHAADRLWRLGIYRGARIEHPPEQEGRPWYVVVYLRSALKSGKPGQHYHYRTLSGATPAEAVACLRVTGKAVLPKEKR